MLASFIIVFREVLEGALVVGIVLAATREVPGCRRWVAAGIGGGVLGAMVVAAFAGAIASALDGFGQELFNAAVLVIAVVMLGWHNIWMTRHGRELAAQMGRFGHAVSTGAKPLTMVAVVVGVAVLREGSETVLFLYGLLVSDPGSFGQVMAGGTGGVLAGAAFGTMLYLGLVRVSSRYLFKLTSWMVSLLAAGLAVQAVAYLSAAGMLPTSGEMLWDSSWLLAEDSVAGRVLHTLIGYTDRPTSVQLAAYILTLGTITGLMRVNNPPPLRDQTA